MRFAILKDLDNVDTRRQVQRDLDGMRTTTLDDIRNAQSVGFVVELDGAAHRCRIGQPTVSGMRHDKTIALQAELQFFHVVQCIVTEGP